MRAREWPQTALRYIADLNPRVPAEVRLHMDAELSFLPMEAIGEDGRTDLSRTRPVREVLSGYSYFEDGDIGYAKVTPCFENGKAALFASLIGGAGFGTTEITVVRPRSSVETRFLFYVLTETRFKDRARAEMTGAGGLKRVPESFARGYTFQLPPLDEQRAIASFLDHETAEIDAFIADQEQLIRLLNERRAATITQAVTKGLDPNAPMKDSGVEWFSEVPREWQMLKLCWISRIGNGSTPARDNVEFWRGGSVPWLNSSCVHDRYTREADQHITDSAVEKCHLPMVPADSLLVGLTGQGKTRGSVTQLEFRSTINQHMAYISPKSGVHASFVYWALKAAYGQLRFISDGNGGTKGALTCEMLGQFKVPVPAFAEQQTIADYLDNETAEIDAAIGDAREAIELSKERRAALISAAVTGKIDVRDHPAAKGAA
jgi:type I restriction enzyme S subunit